MNSAVSMSQEHKSFANLKNDEEKPKLPPFKCIVELPASNSVMGRSIIGLKDNPLLKSANTNIRNMTNFERSVA